jgi:hypothetical protein
MHHAQSVGRIAHDISEMKLFGGERSVPHSLSQRHAVGIHNAGTKALRGLRSSAPLAVAMGLAELGERSRAAMSRGNPHEKEHWTFRRASMVPPPHTSGRVGEASNPGPPPHGRKNAERKSRAMQPHREPGMHAARKSNIPTGAVRTAGRTSSALGPSQMSDYISIDYGNRDTSRSVKEYVVPLGNLTTTGITSVGSFWADKSVVYTQQVDPNLFVGTGAEKQFGVFEKYRIVSASLDYVTDTGSTQTGSLWLMSDPDPQDAVIWNTTLTDGTISSHKMAMEISVFPSKLGIPLVLDHSWKFCDPILITGNYTGPQTGPDNIRFSSAGIINIALGPGVPAMSSLLGTLVMRCKVEFRSPQRSDLLNLVYNARVIAVGATGLASYATNASVGYLSNMVTSWAQEQNGLTGSAYEYAYNPRYFNPSLSGSSGLQFNVPVGVYTLKGMLWWGSGPVQTGGSSTLTLNGANYTWDHSDNFEATVPPTIEFATTPTAQAVLTGATPTAFRTTIRISSSSGSNGYSQFGLALSAFFTGGPAILLAARFQVLREPDFSAQPLAMYFPKGNAQAEDLVLSPALQKLVSLMRDSYGDEDLMPLVSKRLIAALASECWSEASVVSLFRKERWDRGIVAAATCLTEAKCADAQSQCVDPGAVATSSAAPCVQYELVQRYVPTATPVTTPASTGSWFGVRALGS